MIREILTGTNNEELRRKSLPVKKIDKEILKLISDMEETLKDAGNGIGLAAPQVGVHARIILITFFDAKEKPLKVVPMINPVITKFSMEMNIIEEGCLSVPDVFFDVERPKDIVVEFLDIKGKKQTLQLGGLHAREVQHEVDHLEGILFTDLVEKSKEKNVLRRFPHHEIF